VGPRAMDRGTIGAAFNRYDQRPVQAAADASEISGGASTGITAVPRYRLFSQVPTNWIPFLPVELTDQSGTMISRLQRGAVLQPDGPLQVQTALSSLLSSTGPLLLYDEEVPREGICVTRHYQMARWTDGSTFVWLGHRKQVGKGEGSSGLRFDTIEGP